MFIVIAFLTVLVLAAAAGAVLAFRDTLLGDPVRIPTDPSRVPSDLVTSRR